MINYPCPNCGDPALEIQREGFDGPITKLSCTKCKTEFATVEPVGDDDVEVPIEGALCGCEQCPCEEPLTVENVMSVVVSPPEDEDEVRVYVCLNCVLGTHKPDTNAL